MAGAPQLLYTDPKSGELRRRSWVLEVLDGQDRGRRSVVDRSPALIGAAPAAVLVLTDDTVSRYHLEMDVFAEGLRLRDLDSTNGTFIGKLRVRDAFVEHGDTFRLGRTSIRVTGVDEPAAPEIDTDPSGVPLGQVERVGHAIGVSVSLRGLFETLRQVAASPSAVLLEGERGVGKATCARLIHELSPRRGLPFVALSLEPDPDPRELETALFGIGTAGASVETPGQPGALEQASTGTLFIEHVDRLPVSIQPRLLRAVEAGEIQRNGERRRRRVDVRIVSSAVPRADGGELGLSRAILRRLAVVRLALEPLRDRPEDLAALAREFLGVRPGHALDVGPRLDAALRAEDWSLENGDRLRERVRAVLDPEAGDDPLRVAFVGDVVTRLEGDVSDAAARLNLGTRSLFRYLARHDVDLDAM